MIIPLTPKQVLIRARAVVKKEYCNYRLRWPNGGSDPSAPRPCVKAKPDDLYYGMDCMGFVAWCSGFPRKPMAGQIPLFTDTPSVRGGWINTDSMYEEAEGFERYPGGEWFDIQFTPEEGDIVVYHSRSARFLNNPKVGHTGIVSYVPPVFSAWYDNWFKDIKVIHCSLGNNRKFGPGKAVQETSGLPWKNKNSLFLRFIHG